MEIDDETYLEICDLLHKASWCAGKLNVSIKRFEVGSRAEFEALVDARDRIDSLRRKLRELHDVSSS